MPIVCLGTSLYDSFTEKKYVVNKMLLIIREAQNELPSDCLLCTKPTP